MNLVIGNTSQLSQYFPSDFIKISSRNITQDIFENCWDTVYICFAEQKTFNVVGQEFENINFEYTKYVIQHLKAKKIIYYSTAELWNNEHGPIHHNQPFNYHKTDYVYSKEKITEYLKQNHKNCFIAYPFNFNSIHRKPPFLFGKIYHSILNHVNIEIGDTFYYRELLHPKFVVEQSLNMIDHKIIGTGRLVFIRDFIKLLYEKCSLNYELYVTEKIENTSVYRKNIFYSGQCVEYDVLNDVLKEIHEHKLTYQTC
jgi:hypothetical protein